MFLRDPSPLGQIKLVILFSLFGGLRNQECYNLQFEDIILSNDRLVITIRSSKTDKKRTGFSFIVPSNPGPALKTLNYYGQYLKLVPDHLKNGPFFLTIQLPNSKRYFPKIIKTRRDINWFGHLPNLVATALKKAEPKLYTGHSLRRTAATWLAARGITEVQLQTFGRWKSSSVAMGYVSSAEVTKSNLANLLKLHFTPDSKFEAFSKAQPNSTVSSLLSVSTSQPSPMDSSINTTTGTDPNNNNNSPFLLFPLIILLELHLITALLILLILLSLIKSKIKNNNKYIYSNK